MKFITGCTRSCHFDNFWCSQGWVWHSPTSYHQKWNSSLCIDTIITQTLQHRNGNVFILMKYWSLVVLEVVRMTTSSAASDWNFIKMTTFSFQWIITDFSIILYFNIFSSVEFNWEVDITYHITKYWIIGSMPLVHSWQDFIPFDKRYQACDSITHNCGYSFQLFSK